MGVLYNSYQERVTKREVVNCIVSSLGEDKLSFEEIHGTYISLLQAAPDTIATGIYQCVACLSDSLSLQQDVYQAILAAYDGDRDLA